MIRLSLILASFLGFLTCTLVASYAFIKNPNSKINRAWGTLSFFVGFMSIGWAMLIYSNNYSQADLWLKVCFFGGYFIPSSFLSFVYAFLLREDRVPLICSYLLSATFFILFLLGYQADLTYNVFLGFYWWKGGALYNLYIVYILLTVIYGLILLYKKLLITHGIAKNQIIYVFMASLLGLSSGFTSFLPAFNMAIIPFGLYPFFLYPLVIAYAMVKFRLMDINVIFRKTIIYSILAGIFTGFYLVILFVISQIFQNMVGINSLLFTAMILFAFSIAIQPLKNKIQETIDKKMFRSNYEYRKAIIRLSQALMSYMPLDDLLIITSKTVRELIMPENVSFYLLSKKDNKYWLKGSGDGRVTIENIDIGNPLIKYVSRTRSIVIYEEVLNIMSADIDDVDELRGLKCELEALMASVSIPLIYNNEMIGLFNLGGKISQDMYTNEDFDLLTTLSGQLAMAIENATLHEEMLKAQKQLMMAEKLSSLGRISASLAHEIKNPLAAIKGMAQIIENKGKDDEYLTDFKEIVPKEIDRINGLVESMLELSKDAKPQYREIDANKIIRDVLKLYEQKCRNNGIEVVKELNPVPIIKADPNQLNQVLSNLIINAIQAMPKGGTISVRSATKGGRMIIEIADTGEGIPEEKLKNIFEPFFTTKENGTGLGLAITYKIIKDHGGDVEVESKVGEGSRFRINLLY